MEQQNNSVRQLAVICITIILCVGMCGFFFAPRFNSHITQQPTDPNIVTISKQDFQTIITTTYRSGINDGVVGYLNEVNNQFAQKKFLTVQESLINTCKSLNIPTFQWLTNIASTNSTSLTNKSIKK